MNAGSTSPDGAVRPGSVIGRLGFSVASLAGEGPSGSVSLVFVIFFFADKA